MAKAAEPTATPQDISFELERFEPTDGRLTLRGRWFGVRGHRFVRPTLTLALDGERVRSLADLDDKPWAAEDGEPWTASFPWGRSGRPAELELSVAPDITVQLPAPGAKRGRGQRLAAVPRRDAMTASWGEFAVPAEGPPGLEPEPVRGERVRGEGVRGEAVRSEAVRSDTASGAVSAEPGPQPPSEPEPPQILALREELAQANQALEAAGVEIGSLTDGLAAARAELDAVRAELEDAGRHLSVHEGQAATAEAELAGARAGREAALRNAAQAEAELEAALVRAAQAESERDGLAGEKLELASALERSQAEVERLNREREAELTARGAALVMRGAAQALPAYERHVGWHRRALVALVLIGAGFAALIVTHVL